jgi:ribosomal protein S18 acetylase RimI-like enzyme
MITYFVGSEEVRAYLRELVKRLKECDPVPNLWCPLTESGVNLLDPLMDIIQEDAPELIGKVAVASIYFDDQRKVFKFSSKTFAKDVRNRNILLFDAAVHSGGTMGNALKKLREFGAAKVTTYSLVLKRGSRFIPSLWGVMVNDQDRAYFLLERTPNNRLTTHLSEKHPYLHLRRLSDDDVKERPVKCGVASMDRVTWEDRRFDMIESEQQRCTYLLETSRGIVGYLTVHSDGPGAFAIDEVAVAKRHQKSGYGGVLLRFADTFARHGDFRRIRLSAIKNMVDWYRKFGYELVPGRSPIPLGGEEYIPMERVILHHISLTRR